MFKLIGNFLGKVPLTQSAPQSNFISPLVHEFQCTRGFSTGIGAYVGDKRNILDYQRRQLASKYELRRKLYKALCRDPELPPNMKEKFRYKLSKLPRNSAFNRLRNRCIFTGRSRAVYEKFRMSRIVFRELASQGQLQGVKKSSW
ncbi:hypothetical protein SOVF_193810 [Spinacia oleracea]|uniref:Small ribosomal subunit protein uS14m n=1 Tax=Spinacia oleracea TaxID=3562 RepID=A0A9R0I5P5_SPIOL|nr:ribosomal protein S14, mitochondrial [Spinacia oleracea]KNA05041.1 hypothetical protein SOVF_193810 [Spinacia oleracea]